jgi:hypothetical protein
MASSCSRCFSPLNLVGTRCTASLTSGKYGDAVERVPTRLRGTMREPWFRTILTLMAALVLVAGASLRAQVSVTDFFGIVKSAVLAS